MAKVTYAPTEEQVAENGLPQETEQFGFRFLAGKGVDVDNPSQLRKLAGNPFFKVSGELPNDQTVRTAAERESALLGQGSQQIVTGAAPVAPVVSPVPDQPQRGPDKVTPGQADKPNGDSDLRAVHRGKGSYSVVRGDTDKEVVGGLTKADAEAFNALSGDDKEAYVSNPPDAT